MQIPQAKHTLWPTIAAILLLALLSPTIAEADCRMNVGTVTDTSIEIRYDSTSCNNSRDGIELCLKKSWEAVGACNGGTKVFRPGKKGAHVFTNLAPGTAYKIKVKYKRRSSWPKLDKVTTSTLPPVVSIPCNEISNPSIFEYTGDSVKVAFQSAGRCNPTAYLVQAKLWYQRWLDSAIVNTGGGQFGTNNLVLKGIVEGLVALGIVAEEDKDKVMKTLTDIQGTGHKYVALAGNGKKHQITLGGLASKHRYYIRVFAIDAAGKVSSYKAATVKTPSQGVFKREGQDVEWTEWLDRDDPGGSGDYETLKDLVQGVLTCENPLAVECRTKDGLDWRQAGQVYRCDARVGGVCVNADQPVGSLGTSGNDRQDILLRQGRVVNSACLDYEIRFLCPAP